MDDGWMNGFEREASAARHRPNTDKPQISKGGNDARLGKPNRKPTASRRIPQRERGEERGVGGSFPTSSESEAVCGDPLVGMD